MKTILVPTDFSKASENALRFATEIAQREHGRLIVLHVFNFSSIAPDVLTENTIVQLQASELQLFRDLQKACQEINRQTGVPCQPIKKEGIVSDSILQIAEKRNADFIVLGNNPDSSAKRWIRGSNVSAVAAHAHCPVIIVPENHFSGTLPVIVYATAYHHADVITLKTLSGLARLFKSRIIVLHITRQRASLSSEKETMTAFSAMIKKAVRYKKMSFRVVLGNDIVKRLESFLKQEKAGLLALSREQQGLFRSLTQKSLTKELIYYHKLPLMVFHHKEISTLLSSSI